MPNDNAAITTDPTLGLTAAAVAERVADGRTNDAQDAPVRTLGQIIRANLITPVSGVMILLFILILIAGYPKDGLFVGVVILNAIIGIVQELRSKRELDRLALLSAPKAHAIRDGVTTEVGVSEVVQDELLDLSPGDQVVVDGVVTSALGLELDESLLTGEADAVVKEIGDRVMSGSFVASGSGRFVATHIGAASYASTLASEARKFSLVRSELKEGISQVIKWLVLIIPPASALLYWSLNKAEASWQDALQGTVAAAVAMVPDGLVLLTSLSFGAGIIAIARRKTLAKELATIELLARVDTLCLDKTGTITTGDISLGEVVALGDHSETYVAQALAAIGAADPKPNPTLAAIVEHYTDSSGWDVVHVEPFSSARKWAATQFAEQGLFYFGAPDILLDANDVEAANRLAIETSAGRRVLLLTRAAGFFPGDTLPAEREPVAMIMLEDTVRHDAPEILAFFREQGVDIKVISGDNPVTVAAVARRAGIHDADYGFDARQLPTNETELANALEDNTVFGRVTPHQKQAMVGALQSRGRVVAMTGDGVNDVLALKDADMGIAMGSGSAASRAVAQLVLLDNSFSTLPAVLAEGRKVINNVERVANLFVVKAVYAVLLTAIIGFQQIPFPFLPRHLTLIGSFSIGVPGIVLALAPNVNLVRTGFMNRVLRFSLPAGAVSAVATWLVYNAAPRATDSELAEARTLATITLLGLGLVILVVVSRPIVPWKIALAGAMGGLYAIVMAVPFSRTYFELNIPAADDWLGPLIAVIAGGAIIAAIPKIVPGIGMAKRIHTAQ
jgi:cation-transporting P-type ATPase E